MSRNNEVSEILEKIISEVSDVRKSIEEVKKSIGKENVNKKLNEETYSNLINALLKSNIELHAKISELIVILNSLSKDIRDLLNLFKEAAIVYMETGYKKKESEISKKIEELESQNKRVYEVLEKLIKEIEELKKEKKEEKIIKIPPIPPPIPPPRK